MGVVGGGESRIQIEALICITLFGGEAPLVIERPRLNHHDAFPRAREIAGH